MYDAILGNYCYSGIPRKPPTHFFGVFLLLTARGGFRVRLLISDISSLLSTVGRDLSAGPGLFLDFCYCLMVPEVEYVEWWRFSEVEFLANLEAYKSN